VLRARLTTHFGRRFRVTPNGAERVCVRVIGLEAIPATPPPEPLIVVADLDLPGMVALMAERPYVNHVISRRAIEEDIALGVAWKLSCGADGEPAHLLGRDFVGRRVMVRDSEKRGARIEAIANFAAERGIGTRSITQITDLAEELITNALYDAPAEFAGVAANRTAQVVLEREEASRVVYGTDGKMFYLRVRDPFGSLARTRLFEVLARCVDKGNVTIDSTRGGAGLGMMRIFDSSSLVVIHVHKRVSTEFLIGIDLKRRKAQRERAVHLFFEGEGSGA
jgi:hypothetical protein